MRSSKYPLPAFRGYETLATPEGANAGLRAKGAYKMSKFEGSSLMTVVVQIKACTKKPRSKRDDI